MGSEMCIRDSDKREAAYAAAVAAFQKQIDAQNAAYLAALGK